MRRVGPNIKDPFKEASIVPSLVGNRDGNVALVFALIVPVLFCAVGLAVDFQARLAQKNSLQEAADTLALRGARELLLENSTKASIEALLTAPLLNSFPTASARSR